MATWMDELHDRKFSKKLTTTLITVSINTHQVSLLKAVCSGAQNQPKQLKRKELSQQIFTNVNMTFPYTYYGIRAGEKRVDKNFFSTASKSEVPPEHNN